MQKTALQIVEKLQQNGYIAYYAGGAVRDIILGIEPQDIDIATNARPEQIEELFERTYAIGKNFGVILVEQDGHHFEIATFRSDAGYSDGRRPDAVLFTSPEEDALRRDFTINGMFYDPVTEKIHDFVEARKDLEKNILRFIGDPDTRITEDHLRLLRAVRFKNRFDLKFDADTKAALKRHAALIIAVSAERIREEMTKMIVHATRRTAFEDLFELDFLTHIIPELSTLRDVPQPKNYHAEGDVLTHSFLAIGELPADVNTELAWATLLHDSGKKETYTYQKDRIHFPDHAEVGEQVAKKVLRRLKFSRYSEGKIRWLIRHHHLLDQFDKMTRATKLKYFDQPFFEDLLTLHRADLYGCIPLFPDYRTEGEKQLVIIREEYERMHFENLLPSAQPEFLDGAEIGALLNIPPGKRIGELKALLREEQLEGKITSRAEAIAFLKTL